MHPSSSSEARHRLLEAAERLLREQGYEQVSVRAVNKAAGMNPAAVHYHFGSKQELVTALLEQRLRPLWEDRLETLDERVRAGDPPDPAGLVDLLVRALAETAADPDRRWLLGLLARLVLAEQPLPWRSPWADPGPWTAMLSRTLPHLPPEVVASRWRLARDLLLVTYGSPFTAPDAVRPVPPPAETAAFVTAALSAPLPSDEVTHGLR
ncbi:TetR/AcrR family transcriptional regulator [Spirillospora sp. NPDC050679]